MCSFWISGGVGTYYFVTMKTISGSEPFDAEDFQVQGLLCIADVSGTMDS